MEIKHVIYFKIISTHEINYICLKATSFFIDTGNRKRSRKPSQKVRDNNEEEQLPGKT